MNADKPRGLISESWDLAAIIFLSIILAVFIYFLPDSVIRAIIGIPFILFFPGYALMAAIFPEKKSLDLIERIALSFGLSIAVVPLIGFILNYTPFGIHLDPILWSLIGFELVMAYVAFFRREKAVDPYLPISLGSLMPMAKSQLGGGGRLDRALTIVLVLSVISSVAVLGYVVAVPSEGEHFSEFYLLGPGGKATNYPRNLTVGQQATVTVGIANHEYRTIDYTVDVWMVNSTTAGNMMTVNSLVYMDSFTQTLDHTAPNLEGNWTAQWEKNYSFAAPKTGDYKLYFILYKGTDGFTGTKGVDYASDPNTVQLFNTASSSSNPDTLSLNLNLHVT